MGKDFQILSLDGGGIKGLFSAGVLAHIEEDLSIKVADYFDLIVGTSTGGIIALGLGIGMAPRDIVRFYLNKGRTIFPKNVVNSCRKFWRNKFTSAPLEAALKECFGENTLLGASNKRLVVPAYNIGDDDVYLFKTCHHERLTRDYKEPMWKVALATSAAPTYFPAFSGIDHIRLVDGGVWANNPMLVGIAEAVSMLNQPLEKIKVLSLGTTDEVKHRNNNLDHGGRIQWMKAAAEVILQGQSRGAFAQAQHLIGKGRAIRLDPKVPDKLFSLDKLSEKELLSKAAHESRNFVPQFRDIFLDHKAPEFKPCYTLGGTI